MGCGRSRSATAGPLGRRLPRRTAPHRARMPQPWAAPRGRAECRRAGPRAGPTPVGPEACRTLTFIAACRHRILSFFLHCWPGHLDAVVDPHPTTCPSPPPPCRVARALSAPSWPPLSRKAPPGWKSRHVPPPGCASAYSCASRPARRSHTRTPPQSPHDARLAPAQHGAGGRAGGCRDGSAALPHGAGANAGGSIGAGGTAWVDRGKHFQ